MTFNETKDPRTIGKDGKPKAPEHHRNAITNRYRETLKNPIKLIRLLTLENLLDINEEIKLDAARDHSIEHRGSEDFPIQTYKLQKLIESTPSRDVFEIAAYYLKNIIVLQAFPDANHRTALYAVELFLKKNDYGFDYSPEEAYQFEKECYGKRSQIYGSYEERPISVLNEEDNELFSLCLDFVKKRAMKLAQNH